jgi:hypothetical protein
MKVVIRDHLRDLSAEEKKRYRYYDERKSLSYELGLYGQGQLAEKEMLEIDLAKTLIPPLTEDEIIVWTNWLPKSYKGDEAVSGFDAQLIPDEVLRHIKNIGKMSFRMSFEIRRSDWNKECALFGHRLGNVWLLARWADPDGEDAALVPWNDVLGKALRWRGPMKLELTVISILFGITAILALICVWAYYSIDNTMCLMSSGLAIIMGFLCAGAWLDRRNSSAFVAARHLTASKTKTVN